MGEEWILAQSIKVSSLLAIRMWKANVQYIFSCPVYCTGAVVRVNSYSGCNNKPE